MIDIYYIDNIAKLKEQINNIRTHAPNTKPVYSIHKLYNIVKMSSMVYCLIHKNIYNYFVNVQRN